jgi:alpha-D-ribose 1-methylphosphonate 5-triphosphate synthase subunit PhnH
MNSRIITDKTINAPIAKLRENQFDFVHDSQKTFKTLMMALAFPGTIHQLGAISLSFPGPDVGFILQPVLTLMDLETTFYVYCQNAQLQEKITRYIEINTNSQPQVHQQADYILCLGASLNEQFSELKRGTLSQPNKSATVFYLLDNLADHPDANTIKLLLSGPGIKDAKTVYLSGLHPGELEQWACYRKNYPMGIDIYLVSRSGSIIGIPRSVNLDTQGVAEWVT